MDKLEEFVHYICHKFADAPENLGSVKMNKICWFSDVDWYFLSSETISKYYSYIKQPQGPVLPDIKPALDQLASDQKISVSLVDFDDYKQWYYQPIAEYSPNLITNEQREIIDFWCDYAKNTSAKKLSKSSHDYPWWRELGYKDSIPISLGLFKNTPIPKSVMTYRDYGSEARKPGNK